MKDYTAQLSTENGMNKPMFVAYVSYKHAFIGLTPHRFKLEDTKEDIRIIIRKHKEQIKE